MRDFINLSLAVAAGLLIGNLVALVLKLALILAFNLFR